MEDVLEKRTPTKAIKTEEDTPESAKKGYVNGNKKDLDYVEDEVQETSPQKKQKKIENFVIILAIFVAVNIIAILLFVFNVANMRTGFTSLVNRSAPKSASVVVTDQNLEAQKQALQQGKISLAEKETALTQKEEELNKLKQDLDARSQSLDQAATNAQALADTQATNMQATTPGPSATSNNTNITSAVKIYENMDAPTAAKILKSADKQVRIEIIRNMKKDKAAEILKQLDTAESASILEAIAKGSN